MHGTCSVCVVSWTILLLALARCSLAHGVMTQPRTRGCLKTDRGFYPQVMDENAPQDYCCPCQNAGGIDEVKKYGRWHPYEPMKKGRGGFGMCGDPHGKWDHMKAGQYGNPPSMPYVATYESGGEANFEFDATANHGGYLEFYLCDVKDMPYQDISFNKFAERCHYLERISHHSCESGNDVDCGPIDIEFPGRFVLPPGRAGGDTGDHLIGGSNGKMKYRIPDVVIEMGVIQMYWLTQNSCATPDGFMQKYDYPQAWNGRVSDNGISGGKPIHHETCDKDGKFPEEFWNCADVQVLSSGGSSQVVLQGPPGPVYAFKPPGP